MNHSPSFLKNDMNVDFSENSFYQEKRMGLAFSSIDLTCKNVLDGNQGI